LVSPERLKAFFDRYNNPPPPKKVFHHRKPKVYPIIFTNPKKIGEVGQLAYLYKNHAQHMVSKGKAVHLTPETKEEHKYTIDKQYDGYWHIKGFCFYNPRSKNYF
jgi:hypothetical protein